MAALLLFRGREAPTGLSLSDGEQKRQDLGQADEPPDEPSFPEESQSRESSEPTAVQPQPLLPVPEVYAPVAGQTAQELIEDYFAVQYQAYAQLAYVDMSGVLDMERQENQNLAVWSQMLAQRRRLLAESGLCHVETTMLPYEIRYEDTADEDQMAFWSSRSEGGEEDTLILHFRILGEKGAAYPPIMAVNALHTMFLCQTDDGWIITRHYFPGSVRKYLRAGELELIPDEEMLAALEEEFRAAQEPREAEFFLPCTIPYAPVPAVEYAMAYTEEPNPAFYHIGDWMGNCANFVSQCLWAGFGGYGGLPGPGSDGMTGQWYGGGDGGSPAWENVNSFWSCITTSNDLHGEILVGASLLRAGDVIQTRTATAPGEDGRYNHMLLVVDEDTLLLAQNSPACFVSYSDLVNVETRVVRPAYVNVE